jgi:hypothetical protein
LPIVTDLLLKRMYLQHTAWTIQLRPAPVNNDYRQGPEYQPVIHQLRHYGLA